MKKILFVFALFSVMGCDFEVKSDGTRPVKRTVVCYSGGLPVYVAEVKKDAGWNFVHDTTLSFFEEKTGDYVYVPRNFCILRESR